MINLKSSILPSNYVIRHSMRFADCSISLYRETETVELSSDETLAFYYATLVLLRRMNAQLA